MTEKIRLSLDIPQELNEVIDRTAKEMCGTKTDFIRRAIALALAAHEARKQNKIVGVLNQQHQLEKEFIGL